MWWELWGGLFYVAKAADNQILSSHTHTEQISFHQC